MDSEKFTPLKWRSLWLTFHRCLGLTAGVLWVIMGLTGSLNAFFWEMDEWLNPEFVIAKSEGSPLSLDMIMASVMEAHPRRRGSWTLWLPRHERGTLTAEYLKPEEKTNDWFAPLLVSVNPYTGEILANRFCGETFPTFVYEIHADLWMGKLGFRLVGALGIMLLVSLISGVYLWWPLLRKGYLAWSIRPYVGWKRCVFDLHKCAGIYGLPLLAILSLSGGYLVYGDLLKPCVSRISPVREAPDNLKSSGESEHAPILIEEAVAVARTHFSGATLTHVVTPEGHEGVYQVWLRQPGEANISQPASRVWIDQYSGKVLFKRDPTAFTPSETFLNMIWPLHNGEAFGIAGRMAISIAGSLPLMLYITGFVRWKHKRRPKRSNGG